MTERRKRSRKGAPGIVEVARRAGVSPATVSRFFNSPKVVKGPTRKRIETAAAELGYIRDRMAGALHNRFSGTFGLIIPTIDNAIFAEMIEAFSSHLQSQDRTMLIASHGYDLRLETAHVRSLLERRIDGIALVGLDHDPVSLNMLAQRDVPTVTIWNYSDTTDLPNIGADNSVAGKLVAEHLLELGHTDFVTIFPETENNDRARGRFDGVMTALDRAGVQVPPENTIACGYDVGKAKELGKNVLLQRKPSAIICGNDVIAQGVMFAAQNLRISVPKQVSVVGIGDFVGSEHLEPGLTTVRLPAKRIGRRAAEVLLRMSETGLRPIPLHQAIPLELQIRGSTSTPNR